MAADKPTTYKLTSAGMVPVIPSEGGVESDRPPSRRRRKVAKPIKPLSLDGSKNAAKPPSVGSSASSGNTGHSSASRELVVTKASEIKSTRQRFLWEGRIPLGILALFGGRGGVGKSTFALWMGVELQHGRLPGDFLGKKMPILYVSVEDDWETQVKPRLQALDADLDNVYCVVVSETVDKATGARVPDLMTDMPLIEKALKAYGPCVLIVDPIPSLIQADDHKRNIVRAALDPLLMAAAATTSTVIGIMHTVKGGGKSNDLLSGSHAYYDASRSVMLFAKDENTDLIVMSQVKGNYASDDKTASLAYRLVGTKVELDDQTVGEYAYVEIVGDSEISVEEIVNREAVSHEVADRARWIVEYLSHREGRALASEVIEEGKAAGHTEAQMKSARLKCRPPVKTSKQPGVMAGPWIWHIESVSPIAEERKDGPKENSEIPEENEERTPGETTNSSRVHRPRIKRPKPGQ